MSLNDIRSPVQKGEKDFYAWYQSQSHFRTKADRERDVALASRMRGSSSSTFIPDIKLMSRSPKRRLQNRTGIWAGGLAENSSESGNGSFAEDPGESDGKINRCLMNRTGGSCLSNPSRFT